MRRCFAQIFRSLGWPMKEDASDRIIVNDLRCLFAVTKLNDLRGSAFRMFGRTEPDPIRTSDSDSEKRWSICRAEDFLNCNVPPRGANSVADGPCERQHNCDAS